MTDQLETGERRFIDSKQRTWILEPDGPALRKIKHDLGVNLTSDKAYTTMRVDSVKLYEVLWYLCRAQCEARQVTESEFSKEVLKSKGKALEAIELVMIDFMPDELVAELKKSKLKTLEELEQESMQQKVIDSVLADKETMAAMMSKLAPSANSTGSTPVSISRGS